MRELTNGLPRVSGLPIVGQQVKVEDKVRELAPAWERALQSGCPQDGRWEGLIDEALRKLMGELQRS